MLEDNPFRDLVPSSQAPGVIYGPAETPKPQAAPSGYRWTPSGNQEVIQGGPADPDAANAQATQALSAGFYRRALYADARYNAKPVVAPRTATAQTAVNMLPEAFVQENRSPERREADNFADEFIRAKLRKESGAVIGPEEMKKEYETYFPVPGDKEQDFQRKAELRKQAIEALGTASGSLAESVRGEVAGDLDEKAKQLRGSVAPKGPVDPNGTGDIGFSGKKDAKSPFTPEQSAAYDAWHKANPKGTADQLRAFGTSIGVDINNAEGIIKARDTGAGIQPAETAKQGLTASEQADVDRIVAKNDGVGGAVNAGLASGASLNFIDEGAAAVGAVGQSLSGKGSFSDNYKHNVNVNRAVADKLHDDHPWAYTGGQLAGGLSSLPFGMEVAPATSALATIAQGAKVGAGAGALAGYGSGEGFVDSAEKAAVGGVLGGVLGGTISGVSTRMATGGMNPELAAASKEEGVDLLKPMVDQNTISDYGALESNIYSQPIIRGAAARVRGQIEDRVDALGQGGTALETEAAGGTIQKAARGFIQRSKGVADRLYNRAKSLSGDARFEASNSVNQLDRELTDLKANPETNAGEISFLEGLRRDLTGEGVGKYGRLEEFGRDGSDRFLTYSSADGHVANIHVSMGDGGRAEISIDPFSKEANRFGPAEVRDAAMQIKKTYPEIKTLWGERQSGANPGRTQKYEMTSLLKEPPTQRGKTVDELRSLRQSLRGRINEQNLTATQAESRATRILDAAQQDVAASLPEGAATAFRRADTFYRERMTHIDDVIGRFLGPKNSPISGEAAFARLKSMTSPGGDGRRLAALMRDLDGNERQDIAATIAQNIGRRAPDEPFSTALFLQQTRKLSPSARRTIFGAEGAKSIDNLRLLSRKLEEAEKDINRSRSATVLERQGWRNAARTFIAGIAGIGGTSIGGMSGGVAGVTVAAGAMATSAARKVLSARAMVNPRVSLWLADAANVNTPAQAKTMVNRLGTIIAREPALAGELTPIQQALSAQINPSRLAASDTVEGDDQQTGQ